MCNKTADISQCCRICLDFVDRQRRASVSIKSIVFNPPGTVRLDPKLIE